MSHMMTFAITMALTAGLYSEISTVNSTWQSQAVAHGAAEWVVDQKTGNTSFRWKGGADGAKQAP